MAGCADRNADSLLLSALRISVLRHPLLAAWVVVLALAMRLLVPPGYMVGNSAAGSIGIEPCSGMSTPIMTMATMAAHHGHRQDGSGHEQPCAFAGLAMASLAGCDAPQVAAVHILVVAATPFLAVASGGLPAPPFLWPPLRGPPVH